MNRNLTIAKYKIIYDIFNNLRLAAGIQDDEVSLLFVPEGSNRKKSIFYRLCSSLQNSGQMSNSIRFSHDNKELISNVTCDFDANAFLNNHRNWKAVYNSLTDHGKNDNGKNRQTQKQYSNGSVPETNWERYAKGMFEGAHYLCDENENGYRQIRKLIQKNDNIDLISDDLFNSIKDISLNIHGLGIPLTCDWLKECGCTWLVKPDTHINKVYNHLAGLPYEFYVPEKTIIQDLFEYSMRIRESEDETMTAYKLDKMIWLICTGNFYQYNIGPGRDLIIKRVK